MYERKVANLNTYRTATASTTKTPTPVKRGTRQRTGRATLTSSTNQQQLTDEQKRAQRRIAVRAANDMAQIRRRQPRSYMHWGDNRKAVIKRYPDGAQEIMVPQSLTPEQEQYEFPPRSRLLKKLATSTAERHRLSSLQHDITTPPTVPPPALHPTPFSNQAKPTVMTNMVKPHPASTMELDQGALNEWFSGRQQQKHSLQQHAAKDKAVIDWMTDVERSTSLVKKSDGSSIENQPHSNSNDPHSSTPMHDINIHFKSEAAKLVASGLCCQKSFNYLSPPNEDTTKHYVRLQRLHKHSKRPSKMTTTTTTAQNMHYQSYISVSSSSHQRQKIRSSPLTTTTLFLPEIHRMQIPRPTTSTTSPKSSMVRLAQMFHKTLQDQQARAHKRMQQLETLLEEERHKRQDIQRTQQGTMSQLDTFMKKYQVDRRIPPSPILSTTTTTSSSSPAPVSPSWVSILSPQTSSSSLSRKTYQNDMKGWMERVTRLETRMQNEIRSRQNFQETVANTVQWIDGLKASLSAQALEHSLSHRQLDKRINEAFKRLTMLAQQRDE